MLPDVQTAMHRWFMSIFNGLAPNECLEIAVSAFMALRTAAEIFMN